MTKQKRVAAIHDVSGFGRCSLTVALPILSAAGIETPIIPTAVLSTHTGGFTGFTYRDLTEDILPIVNHWRSLNLEFDGLYTGFLGSFEQLDIVSKAFDLLRGKDTLIVVDPVMADDGKLYGIFPDTFPAGMRQLCAKADVIIPNLTEAALLLDRPYHERPHTHEELEDILKALSAIGPRKVVVTGVSYDASRLGAAGYDADTGEISYADAPYLHPMMHGTGDVFGSVLTASLTLGHSLEAACRAAVRFTVESMLRTREARTDLRFGVDFESGLAGLSAIIAETA
jgi:pyridoxine kinase